MNGHFSPFSLKVLESLIKLPPKLLSSRLRLKDSLRDRLSKSHKLAV